MAAPKMPTPAKRVFRLSAGFSAVGAAAAADEAPFAVASESDDETPTESIERTDFLTEATEPLARLRTAKITRMTAATSRRATMAAMMATTMAPPYRCAGVPGPIGDAGASRRAARGYRIRAATQS